MPRNQYARPHSYPRTATEDSALFDSLESRNLLSPTITSVTIDPPVIYPGVTLTITTHASAPHGISELTLYLKVPVLSYPDDSFLLGRFLTPDAGTTDRFTLYIPITASWRINPDMARGPVIEIDARETNGSSTGSPYRLVVPSLPKPPVNELVAETLSNGDIRLLAYAAPDGLSISSSYAGLMPIRGVTFFVDQNGNNQWDPGLDIDLGTDTSGSSGLFQKTFTPQAGWNTTWFAASAWDARPSPDRFGPNRSAVLRQDDTPPRIVDVEIDGSQTNAVHQMSNLIHVAATTTVTHPQAATIFYDANRNGLWDVGIDTSIAQSWQFDSPNRADFSFALDPAYGFGWQAFGIAVRESSGRGDDSWTPVRTVWLNINNPIWVEDGHAEFDAQNPRFGFYLYFHARDEAGGLRWAGGFLDVNNDGVRDDAIDRPGYTLEYVTFGFTDSVWRVWFPFIHAVNPGTYNVYVTMVDLQGFAGDRGRFTVTVP